MHAQVSDALPSQKQSGDPFVKTRMRTGSLRRRDLTLTAMAFASTVDAEDVMIDFSGAALYLSGIQTVFAVVTVACVSVLACWAVPEGGVSAVRTLALCTATGSALMRTPLRIGRAHGVNVIFSSLQPAIPVYILALTVEQLVHTCSVETQHSPSWRRVVFHGMILVMCVAGILRAKSPMRDTDIPFLITAVALLTIAALPPPSVALMGPLCQPVTAWEAAERCLRAFVFSVLYCTHVYSSISSHSPTRTESLVVITRSAAAAVWTMGAHVFWLPVSIVQCAVVIIARIRIGSEVGYQAVAAERAPSAVSDDEFTKTGDFAHHPNQDDHDLENGREASPPMDDPVEHQRRLLADPLHSRSSVADTLFSKVVLPSCQASSTSSAVALHPLHGAAAHLLGDAHIIGTSGGDRRSPGSELRGTGGEEPDGGGSMSAAAEVAGTFGPLRFREVQVEPMQHQHQQHQQQHPGAAASGGGGRLRADDMTAERMRSIVNALDSEPS